VTSLQITITVDETRLSPAPLPAEAAWALVEKLKAHEHWTAEYFKKAAR